MPSSQLNMAEVSKKISGHVALSTSPKKEDICCRFVPSRVPFIFSSMAGVIFGLEDIDTLLEVITPDLTWRWT